MHVGGVVAFAGCQHLLTSAERLGDEARALFRQGRGLLDRLFDGRVAPLVAHFSEQRKLSRKDIAELRKLLEEIDDAQR